ncbi:MAG: putative membrane protein YphA (DoxX/SURF4 family) [Halopseudomonas sp.]|jgi:putative oxidoreductase|uniref:DoxX family protein n=1 Tax=Halopseudomonas sp. TaxID=2901191 RepID=UPI0039E44F6C
MKAWSLLGLRISMGWLLVVWGADKIFNTEHGIAVAEKYYFGLIASEVILPFAGILQVIIGLVVVLGAMRRWAYTIQLLFNTASLLAVATSVIDPWGWYLDGSNALFYPSLIIFAASVLLIAFMNEDRFCVDAKRLESQSAG